MRGLGIFEVMSWDVPPTPMPMPMPLKNGTVMRGRLLLIKAAIILVNTHASG